MIKKIFGVLILLITIIFLAIYVVFDKILPQYINRSWRMLSLQPLFDLNPTCQSLKKWPHSFTSLLRSTILRILVEQANSPVFFAVIGTAFVLVDKNKHTQGEISWHTFPLPHLLQELE